MKSSVFFLLEALNKLSELWLYSIKLILQGLIFVNSVNFFASSKESFKPPSSKYS